MPTPVHALMRSWRATILILALPMGLGACSSIESLLGITPKAAVKQINVIAQTGANTDSATTLDLVFVYDSAAQTHLPQTAPEWFAQKEALLAGWPLAMDVVPVSIPPSTQANTLTLPERHASAVAVLSYARYFEPAGQAVGVLTPFSCVQIVLQPSAVAYQSCD